MTRDLDWGVRIPVPGYDERDDKRVYVWFDAVIGYLSASVEWAANRGTPDAWRDWWQNPDARHFYFMGKDNIVFHSVIWPSQLLGYGEGGELGGGRGATRSSPTTSWRASSSPWRASSSRRAATSSSSSATSSIATTRTASATSSRAAGPETHDSDFTWSEFVRRNNDELVANWGNLVNRTLQSAYKHFGRVPEPQALGDDDRAVIAAVEGGFETRGVADRAGALPRRARGGDASRDAGQPVRQRTGSVGR